MARRENAKNLGTADTFEKNRLLIAVILYIVVKYMPRINFFISP